jgi:hypothetical protein
LKVLPETEQLLDPPRMNDIEKVCPDGTETLVRLPEDCPFTFEAKLPLPQPVRGTPLTCI